MYGTLLHAPFPSPPWSTFSFQLAWPAAAAGNGRRGRRRGNFIRPAAAVSNTLLSENFDLQV